MCPVFLGIQNREYITGYEMLERGILPYTGGWREQPAVWLEACAIIGAVVARVRGELAERERSKDR